MRSHSRRITPAWTSITCPNPFRGVDGEVWPIAPAMARTVGNRSCRHHSRAATSRTRARRGRGVGWLPVQGDVGRVDGRERRPGRDRSVACWRPHGVPPRVGALRSHGETRASAGRTEATRFEVAAALPRIRRGPCAAGALIARGEPCRRGERPRRVGPSRRDPTGRGAAWCAVRGSADDDRGRGRAVAPPGATRSHPCPMPLPRRSWPPTRAGRRTPPATCSASSWAWWPSSRWGWWPCSAGGTSSMRSPG